MVVGHSIVHILGLLHIDSCANGSGTDRTYYRKFGALFTVSGNLFCDSI